MSKSHQSLSIAHKYRYNAVFADRKYKERLSSSRTGINMTKHELRQKDMVITPLIYQGQSPYQIITNHPELDMSVRTLYSYLNDGVLTARNVDLKRKVKFKPRNVHKTRSKTVLFFKAVCFQIFKSWNLIISPKWIPSILRRNPNVSFSPSFWLVRSYSWLSLWTAVLRALCGFFWQVGTSTGYLWFSHFI